METYREATEDRSTDALVRIAQAFDEVGRKIPAHVLTALWRCRPLWRDRTDVPRSVHVACEQMDRNQQHAKDVAIFSSGA